MQYQKFSEINLYDEFFDSLKDDYTDFPTWFDKKRTNGDSAYVMYNGNKLQAFLYMKDESKESFDNEENVIKDNIRPNRLKVGTFKIDAHGTKCGERFIKKIMDVGIANKHEDIYVTIFPKHAVLINLVSMYGFNHVGNKNNGEGVYVKSLTCRENDKDLNYNYPLMSTKEKKKYILSIYPMYHTILFPDSILKNEEGYKYDLVKDVSETNTIHKIYICFMKDVRMLKKDDIVCIYRTNDNLGPAYYRSVVTSVCVVEEVKSKSDFVCIDQYLEYTKNSIFSKADRIGYYKRQDVFVVKMTYNIALTKRLTRGYMINELGVPASSYWGFMEITDNQFEGILKKGEIYENIIVD